MLIENSIAPALTLAGHHIGSERNLGQKEAGGVTD